MRTITLTLFVLLLTPLGAQQPANPRQQPGAAITMFAPEPVWAPALCFGGIEAAMELTVPGPATPLDPARLGADADTFRSTTLAVHASPPAWT